MGFQTYKPIYIWLVPFMGSPAPI